jgi:hypothetical protein
MTTNEKEKFDLSGALKGFAEHYEDGNSASDIWSSSLFTGLSM